MASKLGPLDVCCDAPSYTVVHACESLGFRTPLDVRWYRLSHFLADTRAMLINHFWNMFFAKTQATERTCSCRAPLPVLENYAFTFANERVIDYQLGQCQRCATVFWEEGRP